MITDGQGEMDKPLAKLISDIYNSEADNISSNSDVTINSIEEAKSQLDYSFVNLFTSIIKIVVFVKPLIILFN